MKSKRWIGPVLLGACLVAGGMQAVAVVPAREATSEVVGVQPSALLSIDQNRSTVVDRIVAEWGDALAASAAGLTKAQLQALLTGLRSDQLLAASLAGSLDGLRNVIANALTATAPVANGLMRTKALGDTADDLVYTPVTPCRIVDTRYAGGALQPSVARTFDGYNATSFGFQGGAGSNCGVPNGVAALALNAVAYQPTNLGFITLWPANAAQPYASTINYDPGTTNIANGAIVPVDAANKNEFMALSPAVVHLIVDVVGYFKPAVSLATGAFEVVVGGSLALQIQPDATSPIIVAGSSANTVTAGAGGATINGGGAAGTTLYGQACGVDCANHAINAFGTIGGGAANTAGDKDQVGPGGTRVGSFSTVGGGFLNHAGADGATVSGGAKNIVGVAYTSRGGSIQATYATIGGGYGNYFFAQPNVDPLPGDSADYGVIGGGQENAGLAKWSTIAGGYQNTAGFGKFDPNAEYQSARGATVGGGTNNTAYGNWSVVPGGSDNYAGGTSSFAAGSRAKIAKGNGGAGTFLWSDLNPFDFTSTGANKFEVRSTGGVRFVLGIDGTTGAPTWTCSVISGGSWACSSDRNLKQNLRQLDGKVVLARLAEMPVYEWNPKGENAGVLHYGPTAQDFHAAFNLGDSELRIGQQDADGVALAAIQGLNMKLDEQQTSMREKDAQIEAQQRQIDALRGDLAVVMKLLRDFPL